MKHSIALALAVVCLCFSVSLCAQENEDSKYLAGAVPEVDGKVVFSKRFGISGMSKAEIQKRITSWMEARLKKNENDSRVVYVNEEKGQVVGLGTEWLVFKSMALMLDRSEISYQLTALCQPESCELRVEKIRYEYRNGEAHYTAEDWITDKYALKKNKKKLVRSYAKWRRKTVDLVDAIFADAANALIATDESKDPIVIKKREVLMGNMSASSSGQGTSYEEISLDALSDDLISKEGTLVIEIGKDSFNMTSMTANAGGSLGEVDGKRVVFTIFSPDQPHQQMDEAQEYIVRFYPAGAKIPSVILECRQMSAQAALEGQPRIYTGEILRALVNK